MTHRPCAAAIALGLLLALALAALPALAQRDEPGARDPEQPDPRGEPPRGGDEDDDPELVRGVLFDTYPDADANLILGARMMAREDYTDAFRVYSTVLRNWAGMLYPVEPNRFLGVGQEARKRLVELAGKDLGDEGVAERGEAARLFARARASMDVRLFEAVAGRYFWTPQGPQALELLGDIALERGDAVLASHHYYRLLRDIDLPRPGRLRVLRKAAAALPGVGDPAYRLRLVRELAELDPDAAVSSGHEVLPASDLLNRLETLAAEGHREATAQWPRFMGNERLTGENHDPPLANALKWRRNAPDGDAGDPLRFNIYPAVVGGRAFWMEGSRVVALCLETGDVLWRAGNPFEEPKQTSYRYVRGDGNEMLMMQMRGARMRDDDLAPNYALAVSNGRVYALRPAGQGMELLVIDAETGKRLARWPSANYNPYYLNEATVTGLLSEHGGRLYLAYIDENYDPELAERWKGMQVTHSEQRIVCLDVHDPQNPREVWDTKLYGTMSIPLLAAQPQEPAHAPAVADGRVFFNTDAGVLAALDAMTGEIAWVSVYDVYLPTLTPRGELAPDQKPFDPGFNASPIAHDGLVVIAPAVAGSIMAFDAATGKRTWTAPRDGLYHLAGVQNGLLVAHGSRVEARQWATGEVAWTAPLGSGLEFAGQGTLAGGAVLVPVRQRGAHGFEDRILAFDLATGAPLDGATIRLERGEDEIGNLVLAGGSLISANSRRILAFGNWDERVARLAERLAANPADSEAMFQLGNMHARRGQFVEAIDLFKRALQHAEGLTYQERPLADALNARLYDFYRDKALAEFDAGRFGDSLATATAALGYALEPRHEAALRLARARAMESLGQWAEAVLEYQTVATETPTVVYRPLGGGELSAAVDALARQRRILAAQGGEAYRLVERQARELLDAGNPEAWQRVAAHYGPSQARGDALINLSDRAHAAGNDLLAARYLERFFTDYTGHPRALGAALAASELFENAGAPDQAVSLLHRIARMDLGATATWRGREVTGREAAEHELARPGLSRIGPAIDEPAHPLTLPLREAWTAGNLQATKQFPSRAFTVQDRPLVATLLHNPNRVAVVDPSGETLWEHPVQASSRFEASPGGEAVATAHSQGIAVLDSLTGEPLWQADPRQIDPGGGFNLRIAIPLGLVVHNNTVAASYRVERREDGGITPAAAVVAWHLDSGKVAWTRRLDSSYVATTLPPTVNALAVLPGVAHNGGALVVTSTIRAHGQNGHIYAIDLATGELRSQAELPGQGGLVPPVAAGATRAIVGFNDGNTSGLAAFDAVKGELLWVGRTGGARAAATSSILLAGGRAVLITANEADAFDAETGRALWSAGESGRGRLVAGAIADASGMPGSLYLLTADRQTQFDLQLKRVDLGTGHTLWTRDLDSGALAYDLTQSQSHLVVPLLQSGARAPGRGGQMQGAIAFLYDRAEALVLDKQTGHLAQRIALGQFNPTRPAPRNRPPLFITAQGGLVVCDVLAATVTLIGDE